MLEILQNNIVASDNQPFQRVTLQNPNGMRVQFLDWGATWISCQVPVGTELREVLLGCQPENYEKQTAFMGEPLDVMPIALPTPATPIR